MTSGTCGFHKSFHSQAQMEPLPDAVAQASTMQSLKATACGDSSSGESSEEEEEEEAKPTEVEEKKEEAGEDHDPTVRKPSKVFACARGVAAYRNILLDLMGVKPGHTVVLISNTGSPNPLTAILDLGVETFHTVVPERTVREHTQWHSTQILIERVTENELQRYASTPESDMAKPTGTMQTHFQYMKVAVSGTDDDCKFDPWQVEVHPEDSQLAGLDLMSTPMAVLQHQLESQLQANRLLLKPSSVSAAHRGIFTTGRLEEGARIPASALMFSRQSFLRAFLERHEWYDRIGLCDEMYHEGALSKVFCVFFGIAGEIMHAPPFRGRTAGASFCNVRLVANPRAGFNRDMLHLEVKTFNQCGIAPGTELLLDYGDRFDLSVPFGIRRRVPTEPSEPRSTAQGSGQERQQPSSGSGSTSPCPGQSVETSVGDAGRGRGRGGRGGRGRGGHGGKASDRGQANAGSAPPDDVLADALDDLFGGDSKERSEEQLKEEASKSTMPDRVKLEGCDADDPAAVADASSGGAAPGTPTPRGLGTPISRGPGAPPPAGPGTPPPARGPRTPTALTPASPVGNSEPATPTPRAATASGRSAGDQHEPGREEEDEEDEAMLQGTGKRKRRKVVEEPVGEYDILGENGQFKLVRVRDTLDHVIIGSQSIAKGSVLFHSNRVIAQLVKSLKQADSSWNPKTHPCSMIKASATTVIAHNQNQALTVCTLEEGWKKARAESPEVNFWNQASVGEPDETGKLVCTLLQQSCWVQQDSRPAEPWLLSLLQPGVKLNKVRVVDVWMVHDNTFGPWGGLAVTATKQINFNMHGQATL